MQGDVYAFEGFRLDAGRRTLTDASGRPVSLAPRVFDTLLHLVQRAGDLVDKNALLEAVWPDVTVEENSLSQNISALRRALGDSPGENRFIVTAPGRGYRFVAKVMTAPAGAAAKGGAGAAANPAPGLVDKMRVSVAVMPFANLTGDPSKEYFSDGMADEIINLLARTPALKTPSRMSTFAYKGRDVDAREVAQQLGVDAVLEGSVRAAGDRLRVSARLIDGATGFQLWANAYDRMMTDVFDLQDELAYEIIDALYAHLNAPPARTRQRVSRTGNLAAYKLCLLAEWMSNQPKWDNLIGAREVFDQAIALDPDFARAHAGLAQTGAIMALHAPADRELIASAEASARRALELDPENEKAFASLGQLQAFRGDFAGGAKLMQSAMALHGNPMIFNIYMSVIPASAGHLQECLRLVDGSVQQAGIVPFTVTAFALVHAMAGNDDMATYYMDKAVEIGLSPSIAPLADIMSLLCLRKRDYEGSLQRILFSVSSNFTDSGAADAARIAHRALAGETPRADAIAALLRHKDGPSAINALIVKRILLWLTLLGAIDEAHDFMAASLDAFAEQGSVGSAWGSLWLHEMKPFRDHPRFMEVAKRIGLADYWREYGPPDGYEFVNGRLFALAG